MLKERTRNTVVGLTMLAAMAALLYGIMFLGRLPQMGKGRPYQITVQAGNAMGLVIGSKVDYSGVLVGSVSGVEIAPDRRNVRIRCRLEHHVDLPVNAMAFIGKQAIGTPYVSISVPAGQVPSTDLVPKDDTGQLAAAPSGGDGLIPQSVFQDIHEFKEQLNVLSQKLGVVADDLHLLLAPVPTAAVDAPPGDGPGAATRPLANVSTVIQRLDNIAKHFDHLLADDKLQGQIRLIVQNVAETTTELRGVMKNVNAVVGHADSTINQIGGAATQASATLVTTQQQILQVSEKLVVTLDRINQTTEALTKGQGTTGKLINDPRLYDGLVDLTTSLRSTINDLNLLVRKWKDEGVGMRLR